jgi:hypothetical protein
VAAPTPAECAVGRQRGGTGGSGRPAGPVRISFCVVSSCPYTEHAPPTSSHTPLAHSTLTLHSHTLFSHLSLLSSHTSPPLPRGCILGLLAGSLRHLTHARGNAPLLARFLQRPEAVEGGPNNIFSLRRCHEFPGPCCPRRGPPHCRLPSSCGPGWRRGGGAWPCARRGGGGA